MKNTVLQLNQLTKKFGSFVALNNLSLAVPEGKICGFLGPNGAGKTTTINLILGLSRPTSGSMEVLGQPVPEKLDLALQQIGVALERPAFYPFLSAQDNLFYLAAIRGKSIVERIPIALKAVGLEEKDWHKPVKTYSQGMRQRLGLAAALLPDPRLFILDEPMNGLDPYGMAEFRELVLDWSHNQGKTVFLSSHLLGEMEQICDYLLIINKGQLLTQGNAQEIKGPGKWLCGVQTSTKEKVRQYLLSRQIWVAPWLHESEMVWFTLDAEEDLRGITQHFETEGIPVTRAKSLNNNLEGVFMALTRGMGVS